MTLKISKPLKGLKTFILYPRNASQGQYKINLRLDIAV